MSKILVAFLWCIHWLPFPWVSKIGDFLGNILFIFAKNPKRIARINLEKCFPEWTIEQREKLVKNHFCVLGRSLIDHGISWWSSPERIRKLVRIHGLECVSKHIKNGEKIIFLVPHFVGMDMAGTRLALELDCVSMYSSQKDTYIDHWLKHGRSRFGDQLLLQKKLGIRPAIKAVRQGRPFYYLPDLDYGKKDSIFVPFFGIKAATITGLSRFSRLTGAIVIPCVSSIRSDRQGYDLILGQAWKDFPTDNIESDTARMNRWLESQILTMPEQYYWVSKRFKTRPESEKSFY